MSAESTAMTVRQPAYLPTVSPAAIEQAMAVGDLSKMSNEIRVAYYIAACQSAGLNPLTRPFDLIKGDDGAVRLYPNKGAAEQLRSRHRLSMRVVERTHDAENGLYIVTVQATTPDGRSDEAQGIVETLNIKGKALANAMLRAETKAKRRATLALCGLGYEDSEDIGGHPVRFDYQQGALPEDAAVTLTLPPVQGHSNPITDLYGDARVIPNMTPPAQEKAKSSQAGMTFLTQINAALKAAGKTEEQIATYWERTCARCGVQIPGDIKPSWLPKLLAEVRARLAREANAPVDWREELTTLLGLIHGDDALLQAMYVAVDNADTPEEIGQTVLAQARAYHAAQDTTTAQEQE